MQGKYILFALVVILLFVAPGSASPTQKAGETGTSLISRGATVFIGESNVDISQALNGCHNISWWANDTDLSTTPAQSLTLTPLNEVSSIFLYTFDPTVFSGYTGTWYCTNQQPFYPVFYVIEPQIDIRVWDLDHNQDVTGKTVPLTTNVTYRIDTNLDSALNYTYRPLVNPDDSFYTVTLTDPLGRDVDTIYTGSAGNSKTIILNFDTNPFVTASPYYWSDGASWNRNSIDKDGDIIYPPGTYTFNVSQNLNNMQNVYAADNITAIYGITNASANVTFASPVSIVTTQATQPLGTTVLPTPTIPVTEATTVPTSSPVAKTTTYASLPSLLTIAGIIGAVVVIVRRK